MIRRLLVATTILVSATFVTTGAASADGLSATASSGNIACVWNRMPLDFGLCIGI